MCTYVTGYLLWNPNQPRSMSRVRMTMLTTVIECRKLQCAYLFSLYYSLQAAATATATPSHLVLLLLLLALLLRLLRLPPLLLLVLLLPLPLRPLLPVLLWLLLLIA